MKKILIISRAFYPEISPRSFRATELAKEFVKLGHYVTVLTCQSENNNEIKDFISKVNIKIDFFSKQNWNEPPNKFILFRFLWFVAKFFLLYPEIQLAIQLKNKLMQYSDFDLLISLAQPYAIHWGVALAKRKNPNLCKIWVADCGDPFMRNEQKKLKPPFYFHILEYWLCKKPDFITVPHNDAISAYPRSCRKKIKIIPQGFDFNFNIIKKSHFTKEKNTIYFAYAGSVYGGRRLPKEFFEYLKKINDINFKFIIYTNEKSVFNKYKKILKEKIELKDLIPREELLSELIHMDFLVNFENNNIYQIPSKLIDYTILGKPILSIKPKFFNEKIVNEFLHGNYDNSFKLNNIEQYNIKNVAHKFLILLNNHIK